MSDRKLATIRVISQLKPIKDADLIEVAVIDGWEVVIKKGEFNVGDLCVYFEIDSWIPTELAPFLSKGKEPREYKNVKGERLKTIKLKGQISQGLVLPVEIDSGQFTGDVHVVKGEAVEVGTDVTELLNILKWEPVIPAQLAGKLAGNFPSFIPKTDQERIQNYGRTLESLEGKQLWEVTEKLDGSSMTVFRYQDSPHNEAKFGVCSRNYELKMEDTDNSFVSTAIKLKLHEKLHMHNLNVALQGELIGPGIQKNPYNLSEVTYYVYDIWDIDKKCYYTSRQRDITCDLLNIQHVPMFADYETDKNTTISELLTFAEGQSVLNPKAQREGLVFKNISDTTKSFKVISNSWLLKND
jgi:RNA ligase (TIGR02306 family)